MKKASEEELWEQIKGKKSFYCSRCNENEHTPGSVRAEFYVAGM